MGKRKPLDTYTYPVIFQDSTKSFIIKFPDFPNCYAFGKTYDECLKRSKEVLSVYIDILKLKGEKIPTPTPLMKVMLDNNEVVCLIDLGIKIFRVKKNKDNGR